MNRKFKMPLPPLPTEPKARQKVLRSLLALKRMSPQARQKALEQVRSNRQAR